MQESSPKPQETPKTPEGHYTRESAIQRLKNLENSTNHDMVFFEAALGALGENMDTLESMIADEDYLSSSDVESFVRELAIQVQEYKMVDSNGVEGIQKKKVAAKALCAFLKSGINF